MKWVFNMAEEIENMLQSTADSFDVGDEVFEENLKIELMALGLEEDEAESFIREQYYTF